MGFSGGSLAKNPPAMQEMRQELGVQSLGQEDPLEEETNSSEFLLEKSHGQRRLVGYMWSQKSQTHSVTKQQ